MHELKSQKVTLLEKYFCLSASSNLFYLFLSSEFPQLRLKAQLQTRTHLEQQKAELTANNNAFAREIKVGRNIQEMRLCGDKAKKALVANCSLLIKLILPSTYNPMK